MDKVILRKRVILEPENFSDDITPLLIKKLKADKYCSEKHGYIIDIENIISFTSAISRINGHNIVDVLFNALTIKPTIGKEFECIVNMIFPQGIFAEYMNIQIVIPASELTEFVYDNQTFFKSDKVIKIGDKIKIRIVNTRYKKHKFSCIGSLIENLKS